MKERPEESELSFLVKDNYRGRHEKTFWEGEHLRLSPVRRQDTGVFECYASNGVGRSVSRKVSLTVNCKLVLL